ncbi:MAG: 50S ribosomal protein L6 [Oscillospiraceae bacterium]
MSRIGRKAITIPSGVEVKIEGNTVTVKGPKGQLVQAFSPKMQLKLENGELTVSRPSDDKEYRSLHGLTRTLISNMVDGVTEGFKKDLEIQGVGYRAAKQGSDLVMNLGYSHQVIMSDNDDIVVEVPAPNKITVTGIDKQKVGQFAAEIREKRPPEPYKGKGIRYAGEFVAHKEGKAGKGTKE